MKDGKINSKLVESLLLIIIMTILGILGAGFIPYVFLFPGVFTIFSIRNGQNLGLINIVITGILIGIFGSFELGIFLLAIALPMTMVYANLIIKRKKSSEVILFTAILFFIGLLLMIKVLDMNGVSFVEVLEDDFNRAIMSKLETYQGMGLTSLEMNENKNFLESIYKYALLIIPSIFLLLSLVVSYLNYVFISIGLEKMELRLANRPRLSRFRLPNNFVYAIAFILISSLFIGKLESPYFETIFINLQVLIGFAFIIQGLSVIEHFLVKKGIKLWIRTISYFLFLFFPSMVSILPMLGIMDMVFDIKKIKRSKPQ